MVLSFGVMSFAIGQLSGTAHDFSLATWNPDGPSGGKEVCITCHTPHNADVTVAESPLWNHEVTIATFTVYNTTTLNATVGQPDGISKLCLSCHDGTVELDAFGGVATPSTFITGNGLVGTDLANDHPISFTYDDALAGTDGELELPSTAPSGLGSDIDTDLLFGGKLECASCHDVHGSGQPYLLVKSNIGSALCITCHDKWIP